jgi:hypothetical protein
MEDGSHRFVVGNALRVTTFHDTFDYIRHNDLLLFYHFIIVDDVQLYIGSHYAQSADFLIGKESVGYLDDTLLSQFLARQVIAYSDVQVRILQAQQAYDSK